MKGLHDGKTGLWIAAALVLALLVAAGMNTGEDGASKEERRIAEVLSAVAGAGRVEVALFYAPAQTQSTFGETLVPTGAVVVAEGAEDLSVRLSLIRAVRTLLGLPENAVDVFVMEEERR